VSTRSARGDGRLQSNQIGNQLKTREHLRAAKSHQPEAETTGGTRAGDVPFISPEDSCRHISQSGKGTLEIYGFRLVAQSFLRTVDASCTARTQERVFDVAGHVHGRQRQLDRRRLDVCEFRQIFRNRFQFAGFGVQKAEA